MTLAIETPARSTTLRTLARRAIPYSAVEAARRIAHFGVACRCAVCGARLRRLGPTGYGYPVLERLQVVGGLRRPEDRCPVCHASSRDRLIKFHLERAPVGPGARITHMAPEKGLSGWIAALPGVRYEAGDIEPERYWHMKAVRRMDLTALPQEDGSVDLFICCHVMEHVPDDAAAMGEIARVLAPGGRALLQTPIALRLDRTDEDASETREDERIRRFGQRDHVRLYAETDYVARLEAAGLSVERWRAFDVDAEAATTLRLDPFETLYVCRRRAA